MKSMLKRFRQQVSIAGVVLALAVPSLGAQSATVRINQAVEDAARVSLVGNVSPLVRAASDQGAVADSTSLTHVRLMLKRSDAQQAELSTYLRELQQKGSANYHKWLTPTEYGKRYGVSDADLATVRAWVESHGLTVAAIPAGRNMIELSGTAGAFKAAFKTSIHSYTKNGVSFTANKSEVSIPAALSPVVSGVAHLNTIKPRAFAVTGPRLSYDSSTKRLVRASSSGARPNLNGSDSSSNEYLFVVPADAATIYNTPNATFNANNTSATSYTGKGVTIGIGGDAAVSTDPVVLYRNLFLGDSTAPTVTNVDGVTDTTDAIESYLDLEVAASMAPGATIHYYPSSDLTSGIVQAINENTVDIFSLSFGECEQDMSSSENLAWSEIWQQAAAQGIAVTISSGDSGSAGCDNGNSEYSATSGLMVNGLGSTPYNISVGGTSYQLTQSNFSTYVNTSSETSYYGTAKSYIPEQTWNEGVTSNGLLSANVPYTDSSSNTSIWAGSGGKSNCSTNTTTSSTLGSCTSGYTKPSWQRGTGVPSDGVRDLPDVSLLADGGFDWAMWTVCADYTSNNTAYTCTSMNDMVGVGGTSAATPAFASILALVQQSQGGGRLGQAAANLYNLFNNSTYKSAVFHDVTTGNISVPCTSGTTDCAKNTAGYYFLTGYDTTTGYDLATGLGSVDVTALVNAWSHSIGTTAATVSASPASSSIDSSNALVVTATVTGSGDTPSGSVTFSSGTYTSSPVNLNAGTASVTIPAGTLADGTDTITASYSGDGIYAASDATTTVTVSTATLTATTTTLAASATTATYGDSITLTATVSTTAATGTVNFYSNSALIGTGTLTSGTASLATTTLPIGTDSITATYLGNSSYQASTSSAVTVTVSGSSGGGGSTTGYVSGTSTATVTPAGGYTGTVDFSLSTDSTYLLNHGCYDLSSGTISGTTALSETLTLYIVSSSGGCSGTVAANTGHTLHSFKKTSAKKLTTASNEERKFHAAGQILFGFASFFGLGLLGLKRRKLLPMLSVLVVLGFGMMVSGCGGGSSSSGGSTTTKSITLALSPSTITMSAGTSGVTTGSYAATLTAYDATTTSLSSTASLTLTVQ